MSGFWKSIIHNRAHLESQGTPPATMEKDPRDSQTFFLNETRVRRISVGLARALFSLVMTLSVQGAENLPRDEACIVVANHLTTLDVFPLQFALPRPIFFMAKAELFAHPLLAWIVRQLGAFPVQRGASDQWAMDHARRVLEGGLVLGMFPEGTRSGGRGLKVAKTGAARLALEKNVPIVPVGIDGSQGIFTDFPRRGRVWIKVSAPIYPRIYDDPLSLTERVMFVLAASLPPELRGVYQQVPKGFED
jgi:1-acyl-sn-glycerol-3-phosphate acyltransferase